MSVNNSVTTLNEVTSESKELFLLDQDTLSTLNYESISDPFEQFKNTRLNNPNRLIMTQFKINPLCDNFDSLLQMLHNNLNILLISETKVDFSYPTAHFQK